MAKVIETQEFAMVKRLIKKMDWLDLCKIETLIEMDQKEAARDYLIRRAKKENLELYDKSLDKWLSVRGLLTNDKIEEGHSLAAKPCAFCDYYNSSCENCVINKEICNGRSLKALVQSLVVLFHKKESPDLLLFDTNLIIKALFDEKKKLEGAI